MSTVLFYATSSYSDTKEVTPNQYPYDASATVLKQAAVPRWAESCGKDSFFINNSTSKTAEIFKIPNRGKLQVDNFANSITFNPETLKDVAHYKNAFQLSEGLE